MDLRISAAGKSLKCRGVIRSRVAAIQQNPAPGQNARAYVYSVAFLHPDKYQLDMLWWMGAQFAVGLNYERFAGGQFGLGSIEARKLPARKGELAFELPVRLDLGDFGPLDAVTEAIGPESLSLLLPEGHALTKPIRLEMATPFGDVNALADVAESKSRVLAGCDVREVRLRFKELTSDSRATLRATLSQHRSKELAPVIRSTPQRRPAESLRPIALVMGTTAVSAAVVLSCVLIFQQDEIALASAEAGHRVSAKQMDRLDQMVARVCDESVLDEALALRLRSIMVTHRKDTDVAEIDDAFVNHNPQTVEGQSLKADRLQNLHQPQEADAIYDNLLAELDQFYDDRSRWDVVLSAARNAANPGDLPEAIRRYELLSNYGILTDAARLEYAGVLSKAGKVAEAEHLLDRGSPLPQDLRLLATIYTTHKQFSKAVAVYRRLLKISPDDQQAERALADNLFWSHDFAQAAHAYGAILKRSGHDEAAQKQRAESLLYTKQYQAAVAEYATLLGRFPNRTDLWDGFLMAASGSPKLSAEEQEVLQRIYRQRGRMANDGFLTNLANAVAKHGQAEQAVPLLQALLKQSPNNAALRLRLADALHNLGRYQEADVQFRWLLNNPSSYAAVKSP